MLLAALLALTFLERIVFPVPGHPDQTQAIVSRGFELQQTEPRAFAYGCRARGIGLDPASPHETRDFSVELHIVYADGSDKWFTPQPSLDPTKEGWQHVTGFFTPPRAVARVDFYGRLAQTGEAEFADFTIEQMDADRTYGGCSLTVGSGRVTLENDFLSFTADPGTGGTGVSLRSKVDGTEYATDELRHRMFVDGFGEGGDTLSRAYALEVVRDTPDEVEVSLKVTSPEGLPFVEIDKRFRLTRGSSALEVTYNYRNLPESMGDRLLEPRFKSTFAPAAAKSPIFYLPTSRGVRTLEPGLGDCSPEDVIGGWVSSGDGVGHALAVEFDYSHLARCHLWLGDVSDTAVDWGFSPVRIPAGGMFSTHQDVYPVNALTRPDWCANGLAAEFDDSGDELVVKIVAAKSYLLSAELAVETAPGSESRTKALKTVPGEAHVWRTGLPKDALRSATLRLRSEGAVVFEADRSWEPDAVYRPKTPKVPPAEVKAFKLELRDEVKSEAIAWAKPYAGGRTKALFVIDIGHQREIVELMERMDLEVRTVRISKTAAWTGWSMIERFDLFSFEDSNLSLKKELEDRPDVIVVSGAIWNNVNADNRAKIHALVEDGVGLLAIGNPSILPGTLAEDPEGVPSVRDWIDRSRLLYGMDLVKTYAAGMGRVVEFGYDAREGLTPFVDYGVTLPGWRYYEPMLGTLVRGLLWAAKKPLPEMPADAALLDWPPARPEQDLPVGIDEFPMEIGVDAFSFGQKRYLTALRIAQARKNGVNVVRFWQNDISDNCLREYDGHGLGFNTTITDLRIGNGPFQANFSEPYARTGDRRYLVRSPCLNDPEFVKADLARIGWNIDRYLRYSPYNFNCGDENTLTLWATPFDFCFGEHCLGAFRTWLKGQYDDLADLNAKWGTSFATWDEVMPDTTAEATDRAKRTGRRAYGAWADHRRFMELTFCGHIRKVKELINAKAPGKPFDMSGTQPANGWTGMDFWLLSDVIDIQCAYDHEHQDEVIRSFGHPTVIPWYGYGNDGSRYAFTVWNDAFRFLNYGAGFFDEANFLLPDYSTPKPVQLLNDALKGLREGGARLLRSLEIDEQALIHYSQASVHAAQIEKRYEAFVDARDQVVKKLNASGIPYRFVAYAEIENGSLDSTGAKVIFLPASSAVSTKEAAAIRRFARNGGTVVGDALSGVMDEHCRLLEKSPLADVVRRDYDWGNLPADGVRAYRWRSRRGLAGTYYGFSRAPDATGASARTVKLDKPSFVYDLKEKKSLGQVESFTVKLEPMGTYFFAALPYEVKGMATSARLAEKEIRVDFQIRASDKVDTLHPVKVEVYSPDGRLRGALSAVTETVDGRGSHAFRPDRSGEWHVVAVDFISGKSSSSAVSVSVSDLPSVETIARMTLSGDETLEVTGDTCLYLLDATTDCTLTVTGGGDLHISSVLSPKIRFKLVSGHIYVGGELLTPAALTTAQFRLDASNADSLETVEAEGRTYVNTWADANGGSTTATAGTVRPYLTTESGRTWVDFGSLKGETLEGYGGFMAVPAVTAIREAYVVACPDDSVKPAAIRTTVLTDSGEWYVFLPGSNAANYWPEFVWKWNGTGKPAGYLMDGIYQDGVKMGQGGSWSQGVHVYDLQIGDGAPADVCRFSSLCNSQHFEGTGGFRVGEIATFTAHLKESDRDLINNYMTAKWMADSVKPTDDRFVLSPGTSVSIWNGTGWVTKRFKEPDVQTGVLNLTADTTVNVPAEATNEVYVLTSDGAHTLTKTGSGVLKICSSETSEVSFAIHGGEVVFGDPNPPAAIGKDAVLWLDAEAEDTLTAPGGQVAKWTSVNGAEVSAAAGTTAPVLSTENGRTMVDFGSCDIEAPAYMTLSSTITGVREAFAVAKSDPGMLASTARVSVFGVNGWSAFSTGFNYAGYTCEIFNRYQIANDHYTYQLDGGLSVDGIPVNNAITWSPSLACYGFRLTEPDAGGTDWAKISSLCNSFAKGGFKVGEVLVFKSQLSEENRALVNAYLKAKWLSSRRYRVKKLDSVSGGSVKVLDGATLEVVELSAASKLDCACGGAVVFNSFELQPLLHLDAEDVGSMVRSEAEGKTLVTRWNDTDGGSVYASTTGTAPYLTTDGDRTYMDFGTGKNDSVAGYGASLDMSQVLSGIRDVFFVARPDESLIAGRIRACVVDHRTEWGAFQPGFLQPPYTDYCEMINAYQPYTKQLAEGVFIDGTEVTRGTYWRSDYHLYNFRPCAPEEAGLTSDMAYVNSICRTGPSMANACGGFRVGELLVFDGRLGDEERERILGRLRDRWLGDGIGNREFGVLTVDVGGRVTVRYASVTAGTLRIGGTLKAQRVAAREIVPLSPDAAICGTLDLTVPGTVRLDSAVFGNRGAAFRILSADAVCGTSANWTLVGDLAKCYNLEVRADGLSAVAKPGMCLIIK